MTRVSHLDGSLGTGLILGQVEASLLPGGRALAGAVTRCRPARGQPVSCSTISPSGGVAPFFPRAAQAAGTGLCSECLLSLSTVFFSFFFGSNIDLPERRDSISAQGMVCVQPSVDLIYIMGLTLQ